MVDKTETATLVKYTAAAALSSLLALGMSACSGSDKETYIKCHGVSKEGANHWIATSSGQCKKLAGSRIEPLTAEQQNSVKKYSTNDYIKCYGVAAASKNDCGTKTTACGGSVATPRSKDAWIAIPQEICEQVKGGIVAAPKNK
jgi:uncharacterized membrane protein